MRMDCLSKIPKDYVFIPFLSPRGKPWYVYNALFNEGKCVNKQCRVWICQRGILRINNISQYRSIKHQMQITFNLGKYLHSYFKKTNTYVRRNIWASQTALSF